MFCMQCGKENGPNARFCEQCGASIGGSEKSIAETVPENAGTRVCEWCAESIPAQAFRCPKCQKWRKDIDQERVLSYVWGGAVFFPALLFFVGMQNGWWLRMRGFYFYEFSVGAFLTSFSGLAVLAGFSITGYLCWHYYAKVSRKIGSWYWF